jgi:hypothetical protein
MPVAITAPREVIHSLEFSFGMLRHPDKAALHEQLSEVATRNIFSWTFFPDGVRPEELPMWEHEWLSFLLDQDSDDGDASVPSG